MIVVTEKCLLGLDTVKYCKITVDGFSLAHLYNHHNFITDQAVCKRGSEISQSSPTIKFNYFTIEYFLLT